MGLGLLGGSVALGISRRLSDVEVVGYAHRLSTRRKAKAMGAFEQVTGRLDECVCGADLVILATPLGIFPKLLADMAPDLRDGCIVTDVGSTKVLPHQWAKSLPKSVVYVGSHPMAGSEQQGIEFARDDLFERALTLITKDRRVTPAALTCVERFWKRLGCRTQIMTAKEHDNAVAAISHVPHAVATALVNATNPNALGCAGKGFLDTSRVASGPANVWGDIFLTNPDAVVKGIDRVMKELNRLRQAVNGNKRSQLERQLDQARQRRAALIKDKLNKKELLK